MPTFHCTVCTTYAKNNIANVRITTNNWFACRQCQKISKWIRGETIIMWQYIT